MLNFAGVLGNVASNSKLGTVAAVGDASAVAATTAVITAVITGALSRGSMMSEILIWNT